jgi:hypothetical protein
MSEANTNVEIKLGASVIQNKVSYVNGLINVKPESRSAGNYMINFSN